MLFIFNYFNELIGNWVTSPTWQRIYVGGIMLALLIAAAMILHYLVRWSIVALFAKLAKKTATKWDDAILERKVIHFLCHMVPGMFILALVGEIFPSGEKAGYLGLINFVRIITQAYMVLMIMLCVNAFLNALHDIYLMGELSKTRPIKPYVQLLKIIFFAIGTIIMVAILLGKNPMSIFLGLGAMAAVLMLVFQDTILGLVASVQASANNMVKPGDWISMPSRGTDGVVLEITLNTVKVQNWDNTISTFPTYALIKEAFANWKGMEESYGRRISRSVRIDLTTIHFCTPEEIASYSEIPLVPADKIKERTANGERITNLQIFRWYLQAYLENHEQITQEGTCMVRQLQSSEVGVPIDLYCFCKDKRFVEYEQIQADIFDHIFATIPRFNLALYQRK